MSEIVQIFRKQKYFCRKGHMSKKIVVKKVGGKKNNHKEDTVK